MWGKHSRHTRHKFASMGEGLGHTTDARASSKFGTVRMRLQPRTPPRFAPRCAPRALRVSCVTAAIVCVALLRSTVDWDQTSLGCGPLHDHASCSWSASAPMGFCERGSCREAPSDGLDRSDRYDSMEIRAMNRRLDLRGQRARFREATEKLNTGRSGHNMAEFDRRDVARCRKEVQAIRPRRLATIQSQQRRPFGHVH